MTKPTNYFPLLHEKRHQQKFKRALSAMLPVLVLSACVSSGDIRTHQTTNAPATYATTKTLPGEGGAWPVFDWPSQIGGAALQALVNEALADNPGLKAAGTRLAAAQALAEGTRAAAGPTVGAGFTSTYQRYTEHGIVPPQLAGKVRSDNQLALSFAYDFDFWGRHAAELRAVLARGKAIEAEDYNARLVLASAVAHAWLQLNRQYQQLDLVGQQRDVRVKLDALTQRRIAAGLDSQSDNQASRIQLENLNAEQVQWQEAIGLTRDQLAALLGKGPDRGLSIARPDAARLSAIPLPDRLPLELIGRRPDIVAARWQVEALQGDIASARAQFYPNVNLTAFVGLSSLGLANLFRSGSEIAGIGPAIHVPIFEGGALRAQLKGKVAAYDGAVESYNQTLTQALQDVADQVQSLHSATLQSGHQHQAVEAADRTLGLSRQRRKVGTGNQLQVLASEAIVLQQRRAALDTNMRALDLRISLIKALGGGFDATATGLAAPASPVISDIPPSRSTLAKAAP